MAKTQQLLSSADLAPRKARPVGVATRPRGVAPSAELVSMQFRMSPQFAREFKQAALDRNMKLNALLKVAFHAFMKASN
jgi:hypothetical protein